MQHNRRRAPTPLVLVTMLAATAVLVATSPPPTWEEWGDDVVSGSVLLDDDRPTLEVPVGVEVDAEILEGATEIEVSVRAFPEWEDGGDGDVLVSVDGTRAAQCVDLDCLGGRDGRLTIARPRGEDRRALVRYWVQVTPRGDDGDLPDVSRSDGVVGKAVPPPGAQLRRVAEASWRPEFLDGFAWVSTVRVDVPVTRPTPIVLTFQRGGAGDGGPPGLDVLVGGERTGDRGQVRRVGTLPACPSPPCEVTVEVRVPRAPSGPFAWELYAADGARATELVEQTLSPAEIEAAPSFSDEPGSPSPEPTSSGSDPGTPDAPSVPDVEARVDLPPIIVAPGATVVGDERAAARITFPLAGWAGSGAVDGPVVAVDAARLGGGGVAAVRVWSSDDVPLGTRTVPRPASQDALAVRPCEAALAAGEDRCTVRLEVLQTGQATGAVQRVELDVAIGDAPDGTPLELDQLVVEVAP